MELRTRPTQADVSQCTFWCSVLSDAFQKIKTGASLGLNAPFGAQCFPTDIRGLNKRQFMALSQCTFWCSVLSDVIKCGVNIIGLPVSMHLLVLSAFRRLESDLNAVQAMSSQCTFWCSVLSDEWRRDYDTPCDGSQCTFWCSVLSDL